MFLCKVIIYVISVAPWVYRGVTVAVGTPHIKEPQFVFIQLVILRCQGLPKKRMKMVSE